MRSMTGFGRGESPSSDGTRLFRVEISSVNRKQFELKLSLPREMLAWENALRKCVAEKVSRGALILRVELLSSAGTPPVPELRINDNNVLALKKELERLSLPESALQNILCVPGIVEQAGSVLSDSECPEALLCACGKAVEALLSMRTTEGNALRKDLAGRIDNLEKMLSQVEP
ncbi:MAG: hypothetical protein J6331_05875, partial [Lentisphaeria bacterium]|nr:hypothetical protein [Lentisphaeria bacterium]